jgi:hypothetical protein
LNAMRISYTTAGGFHFYLNGTIHASAPPESDSEEV